MMNVKRPSTDGGPEDRSAVKKTKSDQHDYRRGLPPDLLRPPTPPMASRPVPPPAPSATSGTGTQTASKISLNLKGFRGMSVQKPKPSISIQLKKPAVSAPPKVTAPSSKVAELFNASDSSDEEEMPAEAKMKMRNIGRDTITSSGPYSFGKTKKGFCDSNKLFEKNLQEAMDKVCEEK